ncbi:pilus assembly PilX family protein [Roseateles amylovorans]|uniref:Tfp pilus assembly protein PilX n=1 Tax=Roseateles amylovorans TaxID=2978473 RepID=A0ABY6B478_9BURK|nr:hypothetical protein [Roseateles amylovorans]UXH79349.1 hypothetical protein N4261_05285 [Roseateles amylovorans]
MQAISARRQRGVIMVIALITLAILMIGAVAAIRAMNVSLSSVGNFGFKRDMANQAERALRQAMTALNGAGSLDSNATALNYSAAMLATSAEGIPNALLTTTSPELVSGYGVAANSIDLTTAISGESTSNLPNMKIYYVVDRLCLNTGPLSADTCQTVSAAPQGGKSPGDVTKSPKPVYRITVRVDGPRGSQSFYQATYSN